MFNIEKKWSVFVCIGIFWYSPQNTAVELMAEVKALGSTDSGQTASMESTAKPPPFKDPTFMVTLFVRLH